MAYDYAPISATALRLVTKFGYSMTFMAEGTVPDPVTGLGGVDGATRTIKGVEVRTNDKDFPETLIVSGDRALVIAGDTVDIKERWVDGSDLWQIVAVDPIKPNGTDVVVTKVLVRA